MVLSLDVDVGIGNVHGRDVDVDQIPDAAGHRPCPCRIYDLPASEGKLKTYPLGGCVFIWEAGSKYHFFFTFVFLLRSKYPGSSEYLTCSCLLQGPVAELAMASGKLRSGAYHFDSLIEHIYRVISSPRPCPCLLFQARL